jgi:hypothetical protein
LVSNVSANVTYFRRWYGNFTLTDNLSLAPADYSAYCITEPPDARLPSGGSQQVCGLYDVNRIVTPNNLIRSSDNYGTQKEHFDGIDVSVNMRLARRIRVAGGLSSGTGVNSGNALRNSTQACFVVDSPQALRFCDQRLPWRSSVKLLGTVGLPWQVEAAATFQTASGPEVTADYTVTNSQVQGLGRNLTAGTATVGLIQPGTVFGERLYQLDFRASKSFRLGGARLRAIIDLANALNASTVLLQNNTYGQNWLQPTYILPGRLIKPAIQIDF